MNINTDPRRLAGFLLVITLSTALTTAVSCTADSEETEREFLQKSTSEPVDSEIGDKELTEAGISSDGNIAERLPLSIPGLRLRNYDAVDFTILADIAAADNLKAQEFSYRSEGLLNYGLIEKPAGEAPPEGWPVIVLAHGYIPPTSYSTVDNYRLVSRYFASGGFMVVKPDYRGHGRSERNDVGAGATRTIDYSIDVLNLIAGLDAITDADVENVFLYGHSMGGEIGLRILSVNRSLKAATLWAAVTEDYPENTKYFVRKRSTEEAENFQEAVNVLFSVEDYPYLTPNSYLDSISVPILVHHGTEDESVPFEWSYSFRGRLDAAGVDYEFYEYPGENHNISRSFYTVMDRDMDFFRKLMNP